MFKKILAMLIILIVIAVSMFFLFNKDDETTENLKPIVVVDFPSDGDVVSSIVTVSGYAEDADGDSNSLLVEIRIDEGNWFSVDGSSVWSYEWLTFDVSDGFHKIEVRCFDGEDYSDISEISVRLDKPDVVDSGSHKWAVFVVASNFPEENESKLGNGGLYLAENMSSYFIENFGYSTSNIFILFDDGWVRTDNGYGVRYKTLMDRKHEYDLNYGAATFSNVENVLKYVTDESNLFDDSEVFVWFSSHGAGDNNNVFTGGKLFERSAIFLWDEILFDNQLGDMLDDLESKKTCVIVDACFSGGFADKTIFSFPELFLFGSHLPRNGRVVMTGASKFRKGYASTLYGPLFTLLWFDGITSGDADGFRPGLLNNGRPTNLGMFRDGSVSVEEAFYYSRFVLKNEEALADYNDMESQINDRYPRMGVFGNNRGLVLG